MAKVIIFGLRDIASLAHHYLKHDSPHEVVAFSVSLSYMPDSPTFEGLPVVAFEEVEKHFSPSEYFFFVPMTHRKMNRLREAIYNQVRAKGYSLISYISSRAIILPDTQIGQNCFILENNIIQPYATIGNNVTMWCGNVIGHHALIRDHVYFTSHVVLAGHCTVEPYCFFGLNATIRDGLQIAEGTYVAMCAAVVKNTEPWAVYEGTFARKSMISSKELDF